MWPPKSTTSVLSKLPTSTMVATSLTWLPPATLEIALRRADSTSARPSLRFVPAQGVFGEGADGTQENDTDFSFIKADAGDDTTVEYDETANKLIVKIAQGSTIDDVVARSTRKNVRCRRSAKRNCHLGPYRHHRRCGFKYGRLYSGHGCRWSNKQVGLRYHRLDVGGDRRQIQ